MTATPARSSKAAKSMPIIPPRRKSLAFLRKKSENDAFEFPQCYNLIVTTTKAVFAWSSNGTTKIFHSGSEGIVAARKASDGGGLLAVADSQVVVLHDIRRGMQKSYRLRGSDGQIRLLQYAGDSKTLFFTTTLQNAVQTYSLKHSKLLDPSHSHPSPPTVFALSCDSHLLVSISNFPPTIHLTNLISNSPPVLLHPQCSSSRVVAAKFHPERANVFLLAFADGTCALYDAAYMFWDGGKGPGPSGSGTGGEIAHIKQVHATANSFSASEPHNNNPSYGAETTKTLIGDRCLGVTALALVPGRRAKAVTVGADGKCCVINFEIPKKGACILDSWYIQGPATSLSLLPIHSNVSNRPKANARANAKRRMRSELLVAIGRQDGKVMIFDLHGELLEEEEFDSKGGRVIDVEWTRVNDQKSVKRSKSDHVVQQTPVPKSKRTPLRLVQVTGCPATEGVTVVANDMNEHLHNPHKSSSSERIDDRFIIESRPPISALNHMDLFSPVKPDTGLTEKKKISSMQDRGSESSEITVKGGRKSLDYEGINKFSSETQTARDHKFSHKSSENQNLPPPLPARPTSWRKPSTRSPETKTVNKANIFGAHAEQDMKAETSRPSKSQALLAPDMKPTALTMAPGPSEPKTESQTKDDIAEASFPEPVGEDAWADIAPKSQRRSRKSFRGIPVKNNSRRSHRKSVSFQASLYTPSEASNDTVIDWSAAASRPADVNPLLPHPLSISPRKPVQKSKQKSYLSLSQSPSVNDPLVQWPSFKMRPKFNIHADDPSSSSQSSTHTPPKTRHSFPAQTVQPLAETTHNSKLPVWNRTSAPTRTPPSLPPPPPPPQPPPTTMPKSPSPSPLPCACRETGTHIEALRRELETQFLAQRTWFEARIQEMGEGRKVLEEENSWLRMELVRERGR